jgi:hypothetical protein
MEAGHLTELTRGMTVASRSNIATNARKKAEADFATWLMMAKLGSVDELPPTAQTP